MMTTARRPEAAAPETMEDYIDRCTEDIGTLAPLLTADLPDPWQQRMCGVLAWDIRLEEKPVKAEAAPDTGQPPRKKHKSQRRKEKEQEYYHRQKRMQESQKAKEEAMKRTKCKFFELGRCKEGEFCRFSHDI